jgi:hypothetical protein
VPPEDAPTLGEVSTPSQVPQPNLRPLPPLAARAFGVTVLLQVTSDQYLRDDSY